MSQEVRLTSSAASLVLPKPSAIKRAKIAACQLLVAEACVRRSFALSRLSRYSGTPSTNDLIATNTRKIHAGGCVGLATPAQICLARAHGLPARGGAPFRLRHARLPLAEKNSVKREQDAARQRPRAALHGQAVRCQGIKMSVQTMDEA
jgi:hypothetical protein